MVVATRYLHKIICPSRKLVSFEFIDFLRLQNYYSLKRLLPWEIKFFIMKAVILPVIKFIFSFFQSQLSMQMEIAALRHQLIVYQRKGKRPKIKPTDRILWSWISKVWAG